MMNKVKKKKLKKILIFTGWFLLSGGIISSIITSQLSFATNSFKNSIQLLNDELTNNNQTVTTSESKEVDSRGNQNEGYMLDKDVGLSVDKDWASPFWAPRLRGNWYTKGGYQYFRAPTIDNFDPNYDYSNPGIGFAWYPKNKIFEPRFAAGPGMISIYTRQLERFYYSSPEYQRVFKDETIPNNEKSMPLFEQAFFQDVNFIDKNALIAFLNSATNWDNNFGTDNYDILPIDPQEQGSFLARVLFSSNPGIKGDSKGPNVQLQKLVLYPTENWFGLVPRIDRIQAAEYNVVWMGNEDGQQAPKSGNSPRKDYNGDENAGIMRAITADSFTLSGLQRETNINYLATGNIKFRIFYEYALKPTVFFNSDGTKYIKYIYDINSLRYIPSSYITDYFARNADGSINMNEPNLDMLRQLIVGKFDSSNNQILQSNIDLLFRNLKYSGDDKAVKDKEYRVNLGPENISVCNESQYPIEVNLENKTITFWIKSNLPPKMGPTQVSFQFHKDINTNLVNNVIELPKTDEYKDYANKYTSQITPDDATFIIQNNLNQIFDNIVPNSKVLTIKRDDINNVSGIKNGELYIKAITIDKVYENGIIKNNKEFRNGINFVIKGFVSITNEDDLYTELNSHVNAKKDVSTTELKYVLPQTINEFMTQNQIDNPEWINNVKAFKQLLIDNSIIANPTWANKLRVEDFDIKINDFNNPEGCINVTVTFYPAKGNIYLDGQLLDKSNNNITVNNVNIKGFLSFKETSIKKEIINETFKDNINNKDKKIFANEMTLEKVQAVVNDISIYTFVNNPIILNEIDKQALKYNDWLKDTTIKVVSFTPHLLDGIIDVEAKLISYQNQKEVVENPADNFPFYFKLNGYYSINNVEDQQMFNTQVLNGRLSSDYSVNPNPPLEFIASSLIDKNPSQVENIRLTKKAIIDGGYIKNLTTAITPDDVELNITNINDKEGSIQTDIIIKKGAQTFKNGIYQEYSSTNPFLVKDIIFNGFKTHTLTTSINNNEIQLLANDKPPVFIPSVIYKNLNLSDISNPSQQTQDFINYIAKEIFKQIKFINLYPNAPDIEIVNYKDVIEITSFGFSNDASSEKYNDLLGTMEVCFKLKEPFYMKDSVQVAQEMPFIITIEGFHKLIPTSLPVEKIKNDINLSLNNKEYNVYQVLSDPKYQRQIRDLIITYSPQFMFPDIIWNNQEQTLINLTREDISFNVLANSVTNGNIPNEYKGSFDLEVIINKPWVDISGNVQPVVYKEIIHFDNYKNETNITTLQPTGTLEINNTSSSDVINSNEIVDNQSIDNQQTSNSISFNNWNASEVAQLWLEVNPSEIVIQQRDLISKLIIQQLIDPKKGLIQNWTGQGFSKLNVNDISIQVANDSSKKPYDNFKGTVNFNVTIHNYKGLVNVNGFIQPQQNLNLGTITLSGFRKLMVTSLPIDEIKEALKPSSPDEDINEAIKRIALEDFKSIKKPIVDQQIDGQYVAFNKYPHLENVNDLYKAQQIQIQILNRVSASPTGGSFDIRITINQDWVNDLGEIQKGPFVSELITVGGFENQTNTTTIKPNITLKGFDNAADGWALIASDALYLSQRQLDSIAEQIINNNWIENIVGENSPSSPTNKNQDANSINQISPSDIKVSYAGGLNNPKYDNLEGTALFNITIMNGFGMIDGIAQREMVIKDVKIGGFVKLKPTSIPELNIDSSDTNASDFVGNQILINKIKNQIIISLTQNNMIPPWIKLTNENIQIVIKNEDDWTGSVSVLITIDVPYVDQTGNIVKSSFSSLAIINGFAKERNWLNDNWFIILIATVGGVIVIILLVIFIMRKWKRDQLQ